MSLKIRRGLAASRTSITPAEGEFIYTTDTKNVYIGDGTTAGGNILSGGGSNTAGYLQVSNATTLFNNRLTVANSKAYLQVANSKQYLQVSNATTLFNNRLTVANSKTYLQVANSKTYLQVANAATLYATKVNPTTSGLLAHTGRATISTNLNVSGNTTVSGLIANGTLGISNYVLRTNGTTVFWGESTGGGGGSNTAGYLQVANATILFNNRLTVANSRFYLQVANSKTYLQVANADTLYATKISPTTSGLLAHTGRATISTNLDVSGNTTVSGLIANGTLGTSNYVLKTNGSTVFWGASAGGGGGAGDVVGPASSTNNAIVVFDGATGKLTRNSLVTISSTGAIVAPSVGSIIPFYYDNQAAFPSAASYHGAIAHSHSDGKMYFAHGGSWNALANNIDVNDRLQVANAVALYTTKSNPTTSGLLAHTGRVTVSTNLAVTGNTTVSGLIANGSLGTSNYVLKTNGTTTFWGESTGGGGSTTQYLQVANAATLYATKSNPTTSGILAHTGRVTVSTNLYVSGNTVLGDPTVTTDRTVINGVLVANGNLSVAGNTTIGAAGKRANATGWFGVTGRATISTNLFVAGNTIVKGLSANGTLGTSNYVLKTNGSTVFWGAAASGGGVTLADETASATTHYPVMSTTSSGTLSSGKVTTTKLYFTPSTGQLNATIFNSLSDKRVKKNIKTVDDALNTVNDLRGVKFNWKETSTPSIGLIAQEVEKLLPELVHTGHNGEKSVNYGGVVGVLVEAIKELTTRIEKLEGK
jgi:sulfur carrier protein ThiS